MSPRAERDYYEPDGHVFALFREISARSNKKAPAGEMWVPNLGILAASFESVKLTRRTGPGEDALRYDFTAECRTISPAIIANPEYVKSITIRIGGSQYRVEPKPDARMVVFERTRLRIEGVTLCRSL